MRGALLALALTLPVLGCIASPIETEPHRGNVANIVGFHDEGVLWELGEGAIPEATAAQWKGESASMFEAFMGSPSITPIAGASFLPVAERVARYAEEQPGLSEADKLERATYSQIYIDGFRLN